jgi:hypothetical protein
MNKESAGSFKTTVAEQRQFALSRLRVSLVVLSLLVPPAASMFMAYDALVTRYIVRHLVPPGTAESSLPSRQVVSVMGRIRAQPVQLPEGYPQFRNALMVIELHEQYRHGKRGGWRPTRRQVWISDPATFEMWQLAPRLIENAAFDWYRASPCAHYSPRPGWVANCDRDYAYSEDDDDLRYSYRVTPIPEVTMTIIAAVTSGGQLTTIEHRLSAPPANLVLWENGPSDVAGWLRQRLARQSAWSAFWAILSLGVVWGYMYATLRSDGKRTVLRALGGGLWRALATVAPLIAVFWPFDGPGFIAVAFIGAFVYVVTGFALWASVGSK